MGRLIYDLGNKQWDIPKLRELLENILPQKATFDNYEVDHEFATIGRRTMVLNARQIEQKMSKKHILLAIEDITERKQLQDELEQHRNHLEEKVNKRTYELQVIINSMADREIRMAEIKKVIKKLHVQLEEAGMTPVADDPLKVGKSEE
jgi:hypothetical protein